uniref:Uncharacterized protein n=1 Tax=Avena sativa TaxID=4498 RepID=A0ACD5XV34_AVESA
MAPIQENKELIMSTADMLQAHLELCHHSFAYVKSMALRAAIDLGIPGAIQSSGGAATLSGLASKAGIHPTKLSNLRRLLRVLTTSGILAATDDEPPADSETAVYTLTPVSRLLAGGGEGAEGSHNMTPLIGVIINPLAVAAHLSMSEWFTDERAAAMSLFEVAHGCTRWDKIKEDPTDGAVFNAGMVADSRIIMDALLRDDSDGGGEFLQGVNSLVDAGGGHGAIAVAIARSFPHVKCTVLDLAHVVAGAPPDANVKFVAGDMFEHIPPADAVLLKWILHCWKDEDCVKILRRCKEAIPTRDAGGKVIIIDMVVGSAAGSQESKEMQVLFDLFMMYIDGVEREEHEWSKIFTQAGFSDYKIKRVLGFRSIIEVYP